jgi:CheY-like chemotaxis protein
MPGFSTSPIITDLSGRGVGMDVVKKSIVDELKGTVVIETREGTGTTFLLRLPLNLAVFPLFFVSAGGKTCAMPATSLVEMLLVQRGEIIEIVNKRAIRLREQIIPVESLAALIKLPSESVSETDEVQIVIIRDGEEKLGLLVDEIIGREEMVVKPLPSHLQNLRIVSGVTIGERDSIINVLHVPELFKQSHEIAEPGRRVLAVKEDRIQTVLVVDDSINTREIEKSILEAYGYTVVTAEDGEDGWEKTRETLFELVITDVEMPRLDGFSFTERLRADDRYRHVPIIIVTSREKDEDKRRGIQVGANAYIVKGAFDQSNLIETVRSLIG